MESENLRKSIKRLASNFSMDTTLGEFKDRDENTKMKRSEALVQADLFSENGAAKMLLDLDDASGEPTDPDSVELNIQHEGMSHELTPIETFFLDKTDHGLIQNARRKIGKCFEIGSGAKSIFLVIALSNVILAIDADRRAGGKKMLIRLLRA